MTDPEASESNSHGTEQDVSPGKLLAGQTTTSTKDYVAATLNAWSNCPGIVKRQLDKQATELSELKETIRDLNIKLT